MERSPRGNSIPGRGKERVTEKSGDGGGGVGPVTMYRATSDFRSDPLRCAGRSSQLLLQPSDLIRSIRRVIFEVQSIESDRLLFLRNI